VYAVKIVPPPAGATVPPLAKYVNENPAVLFVTKKNPSARSADLLAFARPDMEITEPIGGGVEVETVIVEGVVDVPFV
jgi:hypothetical protein